MWVAKTVYYYSSSEYEYEKVSPVAEELEEILVVRAGTPPVMDGDLDLQEEGAGWGSSEDEYCLVDAGRKEV
jgi:hypothetical protein